MCLNCMETILGSDFKQLIELMQHPLILDGRNIYDPQYVKAQGFAYMGVGR